MKIISWFFSKSNANSSYLVSTFWMFSSVGTHYVNGAHSECCCFQFVLTCCRHCIHLFIENYHPSLGKDLNLNPAFCFSWVALLTCNLSVIIYIYYLFYWIKKIIQLIRHCWKGGSCFWLLIYLTTCYFFFYSSIYSCFLISTNSFSLYMQEWMLK